ncbi:MAG: M48 family metallopeptidase [Fibromonadales bacterium]|nr:M48 family metallopeptidase [Fibromonadales bacterium]
MSNKWKFFWAASLIFVVFFQACGMHSWEELIIGKDDEKKMGREFDSLIKVGDKSVMQAGEYIFTPQTPEQTTLYDYLQARAKSIINVISKDDLEGILPSSSVCGSNGKQKCTKDNFFEFKIISSKTKNAFAVPGGYIYFYTEILKDFQTESELSSVLGHEIGHVVLHHSRDRMVKSAGASAIISVFLGDGIAGLIGLLGANFWLTKNGQEDESASDAIAFVYTDKIGISSKGLGDFFGRALKTYNKVDETCDLKEEGSWTDVFSTHPPSCKRVMDNNERIAKAKSGQTLTSHPRDVNYVNGKSYKQLVDEAKL